MNCLKRYLLLFVFLLSLYGLGAQHRHKMEPFYKGRYSEVKIPRDKQRIICPSDDRSRYPYHALGIRLGDPMAVTYKIHMSPTLGFVMDMGRTASGLYETFHRDNFVDLVREDTLTAGNAINYFEHTALKDGAINLKFTYGRSFRRFPEMRLYAAGGLSFRWIDMDYAYVYESQSDGDELRRFAYNRTTMGLQFGAGLEYAHPDLPVSSFLEIEMYRDMNRWPGWMRILGGVGFRYRL